MILVPERFWITSGTAEGETELNAFDNALLKAGIGDFNLVKVSSILPKGANEETVGPPLREGAVVPCVLGVASGTEAGEKICACVGVGRSKDRHGIIMEYSGHASAEEAEHRVRAMLVEAFDRRNMTLDSVVIRASETTVEKVGCTVAAVVLW